MRYHPCARRIHDMVFHSTQLSRVLKRGGAQSTVPAAKSWARVSWKSCAEGGVRLMAIGCTSMASTSHTLSSISLVSSARCAFRRRSSTTWCPLVLTSSWYQKSLTWNGGPFIFSGQRHTYSDHLLFNVYSVLRVAQDCMS